MRKNELVTFISNCMINNISLKQPKLGEIQSRL